MSSANSYWSQCSFFHYSQYSDQDLHLERAHNKKMFRLQARLSTLCQSARVQLPDVARGHNHHGYKLPPGVACCSTQAKSQSKPEEKIKKLMVANRGIASLVLYLLLL